MNLFTKWFGGGRRAPDKLATDSPASVPLETGSVLRQHFITQIYAKVVDVIGVFNPKAVTINSRLIMRNHPDVAFASAINRGPLVNAQWTVESRDERIKAFVEAEFRRHYRAIARASSLAIGFGYQVTEKVWKTGPVTLEIEDKVGGTKSTETIPVAWTFDRFKSIDPRTIVLHVDPKTDQWDGVQQYVYLTPEYQNPQVLIGPERVALWTFRKDDTFGRLTGHAMFDQSYMPWWNSEAIQMYANRYFESKGDPTPIAQADLAGMIDSQGNKLDGLDFMAGVLKLLKGGNGVVIPSDRDEKGNPRYDIRYLEDTKRGDLFENYLKYLSTQILQGQLVPQRVGGAHSGSGLGTHDASVQQDQHAEFLESTLYDFFDHINEQYVDPLVIYNFGLEAWEQSKTRLVVSGLSAGMKSLLKEVLFKAFDEEMTLGSGMNIPLYKRLDAPAIMKELDVPMPSADDLAELEAEQQQINQQNQAMQDAALKGGGEPPKEPSDDQSLSRFTFGEDLGEIRSREELEKSILSGISRQINDWERRQIERQELEAKKPDESASEIIRATGDVLNKNTETLAKKADAEPQKIDAHLHLDAGSIPITVPITHNAGDTHIHQAPTSISTEIHAHPGKKVIEVVGADGSKSTATVTPEGGGK